MSIKKEPRLYDPLKTRKADYAGRVDLLAECSGRWEQVVLDGIYVLDWKSSKEPQDAERGYDEWPMQLGGYFNGTAQDSSIKEYLTGAAMVRLDKLTGIPSVYDYSATIQNDITNFHNLVRYYQGVNPEFYEKGIPSVTSVLQALAKPALIQWAANCSRDWILERLEEHVKTNRPIHYGLVRRWAEEAPKNFRKISKVAADIGVDAHALIEKDLKYNEQPKKRSHLSLALENAWEAYLAFKDAVNLKPIKIEYKIHGLIS
jgi:hypothetical protein